MDIIQHDSQVTLTHRLYQNSPPLNSDSFTEERNRIDIEQTPDSQIIVNGCNIDNFFAPKDEKSQDQDPEHVKSRSASIFLKALAFNPPDVEIIDQELYSENQNQMLEDQDRNLSHKETGVTSNESYGESADFISHYCELDEVDSTLLELDASQMNVLPTLPLFFRGDSLQNKFQLLDKKEVLPQGQPIIDEDDEEGWGQDIMITVDDNSNRHPIDWSGCQKSRATKQRRARTETPQSQMGGHPERVRISQRKGSCRKVCPCCAESNQVANQHRHRKVSSTSEKEVSFRGLSLEEIEEGCTTQKVSVWVDGGLQEKIKLVSSEEQWATANVEILLAKDSVEESEWAKCEEHDTLVDVKVSVKDDFQKKIEEIDDEEELEVVIEDCSTTDNESEEGCMTRCEILSKKIYKGNSFKKFNGKAEKPKSEKKIWRRPTSAPMSLIISKTM